MVIWLTRPAVAKLKKRDDLDATGVETDSDAAAGFAGFSTKLKKAAHSAQGKAAPSVRSATRSNFRRSS